MNARGRFQSVRSASSSSPSPSRGDCSSSDSIAGGGGVRGSKRSRTSSLTGGWAPGPGDSRRTRGRRPGTARGVCGDPRSGPESAALPSLRGKAEGAGGAGAHGAARGPCPDAHAPDPGPRRLLRRPVPEGLRAGLSPARGTPGRTMTLPSAANASADASTGRPPALEAGPPPGLRFPAAGKGFGAPRVSASHFQPCGPRTRRSCCTQSQDRPIVLARSRCLSPGSARPGRS